jgi:hypothetical protein
MCDLPLCSLVISPLTNVSHILTLNKMPLTNPYLSSEERAFLSWLQAPAAKKIKKGKVEILTNLDLLYAEIKKGEKVRGRSSHDWTL